MTLFDTPGPRLFGIAPGADFPAALVAGLEARMRAQPPEALARVDIYVNTRRMARRLAEIFDHGPARLLPRIRLITDLGRDAALAGIPPAVSPLRRRLELAQLVAALLDRQPDLAPRPAIYDLADSLGALMDEMQGEGVAPETLYDLDVSAHSGHWQRSLAFLRIVEQFFGPDSDAAPDLEGRQRQVIERLVARWEAAPPDHPVLVAGSTGSRGATALFMRAVARLPQGAVILPGFDFETPEAIWDRLEDARSGEDHPQYRFAALARSLDRQPGDVQDWTGAPAPSPGRNRLISLAMRPAPVTDQWLQEGPELGDLVAATASLSLIEAPSARWEALALALRLRDAAETGRRAALITPDRTLARQVAAALDRWGIEPDDSAGEPLSQSAPGRFLRQISALFGRKLTSEALLALLKHPLTASGGDRGQHLIWSRELELRLRRYGPAFPQTGDLERFAADKDAAAQAWAAWVAAQIAELQAVGEAPLADHLDLHLRRAEALAAGPEGIGTGGLWERATGRKTRELVDELLREAAHGGVLDPHDYAELFTGILEGAEANTADEPHPDIMIWGTLEARVQGADLVLLAGLNDGTWPAQPPLDPWLNRPMRMAAGLLLPERRIGLSAHDFQQAIGAPEVVLSRAIRSDEAETVPSRWLNRICNLLDGLEGNGGKAALAGMRARGAEWLAMARAVEDVGPRTPPARRPSPKPPVDARPKRLSVTQIKTLIRDPYAIYARNVLRLNPLDPLRQSPDARLRGTVIHEVLEEFIPQRDAPDPEATLLEIATRIFEADIPWPAFRRFSLMKLRRNLGFLLETEAERAARGPLLAQEAKGELGLTGLDFTLSVKADRIDGDGEGSIWIYDYKTGMPPSEKEQLYFDKQLLLTAAMAERGAFETLPALRVRGAEFIGLGSTPKIVPAPLEDHPPGKVWEELHHLIAAYADRSRGYTARLALHSESDSSDYDQLSRFGEWQTADDAAPEEVGE